MKITTKYGEFDYDEKELDKIMKLNMYVIEKYNNELFAESGIEETDNEFQRYGKINKLFDKIYAEMCEKYPLMWYEYCLTFNGTNDNKGE